MRPNLDDMDIKFMREALRQARKGLGRTSPNPAVGAVVVMEGRIIAKGYHRRAGCPHAEVEALKKIGGRAPGGTLYVTLEPCNHQGKTPPCTEAIWKSGIKRVVVGLRDPNPNVAGGGCEFLRDKGLKVQTGVLEEACRKHHAAFIKFVTTGRPFVIAKSALTLDGWTGTSTGHSKWVTGEKARQWVHRLRNRVDAVMVGVGTVVADNPLLTTRLHRGRGKDPLRIVLDTALRIPREANVLNHESSSMTYLVVGPQVSEVALRSVQKKGVEAIRCPTREGRIDLAALMDLLGRMSLTSLLVEGGASVMGSMLRERLVDQFYVFKAPKILGGNDGIPMAAGLGPQKMDRCLRLKDITIRRIGDDILVMGYPDDAQKKEESFK